MKNAEYTCAVCGKMHTDIISRAKCEIACTEKAAEEARKAAELKKKEEQKTRKAEVDKAFESLHKLVTEYVKDYGHYEYDNGEDNTDFYWPSRLWHNFW